jgi:hypothetical protein
MWPGTYCIQTSAYWPKSCWASPSPMMAIWLSAHERWQHSRVLCAGSHAAQGGTLSGCNQIVGTPWAHCTTLCRSGGPSGIMLYHVVSFVSCCAGAVGQVVGQLLKNVYGCKVCRAARVGALTGHPGLGACLPEGTCATYGHFRAFAGIAAPSRASPAHTHTCSPNTSHSMHNTR